MTVQGCERILICRDLLLSRLLAGLIAIELRGRPEGRALITQLNALGSRPSVQNLTLQPQARS
jgi:hypothetical protein